MPVSQGGVHDAQDIVQMDLRTLRLTVAKLMGYSDIVVGDDDKMHAERDGLVMVVPDYTGDPLTANELLMRLEWGGVAYALRHEPGGPGDHFGFYLKGAHVLGPSRAIAICRGFVLAALLETRRAKAQGG